MDYKKLSAADKARFNEDGYVLIKGMLKPEEVKKLYDIAIHDQVISNKSFDRGDANGLRTKLALWYSLADDAYSLLARSKRIVEGVQLLLEGKPAHFHSKLMQKEPKVGGAWEWHQDYGYWYRDGFLYPQMLSVLTALSPATKENGCLQVIKGSHLTGRIEHGFSGEQVGANQERVDELLKRLELVYVEMEAGDTLFFHSNTLHRSDANLSDAPRWSLISAYNLISNKPYKGNYPSASEAIQMVNDESLLASNSEGIQEDANFLIK
ncbi:Ectoine hydroxylase-related dioxygenase, phytanoyl-CoA dioxygenase (PhyH) family [Pedobacter sp. ok626]|uniref:phytanoyl-CoA dioxygenase family protein n=1 Tax=Pedobacter sp. ok626 TaxID=1761882 RepID=UPI00087FE67A|nr:phytanoyl-CoA dioxygenase family protein [Pedobacter sp. ok626]SDJ05589.1 Ectoine hydroxylase-related dioxygenase, phytanoyl-CoA dioxygenase (PhyH) family [Pedobacter sp. ok626]